jgi:putative heme-binding domain-containing protein
MKSDAILASIVSPSAVIDDKYAQTIVVTAEGEVVQGHIEQETSDRIVLRASESFAKPRTIRKADIDSRSLSKVSAMPAGTINHLELDEVLDLLAYLFADGDSQRMTDVE